MTSSGGETWPPAPGAARPTDYGTTTPTYPEPGTTYPASGEGYPAPSYGQPYGTTGAGSPGDGGDSTAGEVIGKAQQVAGTGMEEASRLASEAADHARDLIGQLRTQIDEQSREQLGRLSTTVREFAQEIDRMVEGGGADGPATTLARDVSRRAWSLSRTLGEQSGGSLLGQIERGARRRPGMFLLGAAVAGMVAGRLAKDVKHGSALHAQDDGYGRHGRTGEAAVVPPPLLPSQIDLTDSGNVTPATGTLPTTPGLFDDRPGATP